KPRVAAWQCLAPEVTPQSGIVTDAAAVTFPGMPEHSSALLDIACPDRLSGCIKLLEELIGLAIADLIVRNTRQHHLVGGFVCAVRVGRTYVNKMVARAAIIPAEVDERRAAEALRESPIAPDPGRAVVAGPGELRVCRVAHP